MNYSKYFSQAFFHTAKSASVKYEMAKIYSVLFDLQMF